MLKRRSLIIFYFLVVYIFISFTWWVMLLIRISNEAYTEKRELLQLNFIYQNKSSQEFEASEQMQEIEKERHRKEFMIAGEGTVFLIILVVMTFKVNRSLNREVKVMQQQKNFLLSITHELRSPIASSKIAMQTLLKHRQLPPEKYESMLHNAVSDMDRLQLLVENLLLAAKIEDHTFRIANEACNLSDIATHVLQKTEEQFSSVRKFESSISPDVIVSGDKTALTSVINNLIENAIKYSTDQSKIKIDLKEVNEKVVLKIADDGLGIPDIEKKKVFQKFYRIGQEETRKTKGTGLGLFIVEKILALHKGSVSVSDNLPRGSIFEVTLPKAI